MTTKVFVSLEKWTVTLLGLVWHKYLIKSPILFKNWWLSRAKLLRGLYIIIILLAVKWMTSWTRRLRQKLRSWLVSCKGKGPMITVIQSEEFWMGFIASRPLNLSTIMQLNQMINSYICMVLWLLIPWIFTLAASIQSCTGNLQKASPPR